LEPLWYAALGVLAFAEDGEQFAHEWSSGDDRYSIEETKDRLDRYRQFGPTTCAKFYEHNPTICERCPWWEKINSPIALGHAQKEFQGDCIQQGSETAYKEQASQHHTNSDHTQHDQTNGQTAHEQNEQSDFSGETVFPLRWHGEADPSINRKWLIKKLLSETGVGLISGQWGTAKTFIAMDLSFSVMTGHPFAGRAVKRKGGVLFIAAEGASEIPIRLAGLVETKLPDHKGRLPFAWAESCPTLLDNNAISALDQIARDAAARMQSEFGVDLVLIIVDTMSAAAGFKDENASAEGQFAMNVLNDLSRRTGALVIACDHFGKMVETGTRGSSAKEAAADVVIACLGEKTQTGHVTSLRIAVRKLRSGATGAETAFSLKIIDMGVDEDGDAITTCVVDWTQVTVGPPPQAAKGKGWPKSTALFRVALVTTLKLHGQYQQVAPVGAPVIAVDLDRVREEFDKTYPVEPGDRTKQLNNRRQQFKRSWTTAQSRDLIGGREIDGKFMVWLTDPMEEGVTAPWNFGAAPAAQPESSQHASGAPAGLQESDGRLPDPVASKRATSHQDPWADLDIPESLRRSREA
jgi:hypothetical protein